MTEILGAAFRLVLSVLLAGVAIVPASSTTAHLLAQSDAGPSAPEAMADNDRAPATGAARLLPANPPYPDLVRQALDRGHADCLAEGGTALEYRPGIVRTADLSGDGRADYVVDFRAGHCEGRESMFNGTGGWDLDIFVARPEGGVTWVFSGRVRDYEISDGPGQRTITFHLHGGFCGLGGLDECVRTRRMDAEAFEFREP